MHRILIILAISAISIWGTSASLQELFGTKVIINSDPAGAEIRFDGDAYGNTPITITGIHPGIHEIFLSAAGYEDYLTSVEIGRERNYDVFISLSPVSNSQQEMNSLVEEQVMITPTSTPMTSYYIDSDVDASLTGAVMIVNPPTIMPTPTSEPASTIPADVSVIKEKFRDKIPASLPSEIPSAIPTISGEISSESRDDLISTLSTGSFSIDSIPSGAQVFVDGIEAGTTPLAIQDLPSGSHEISLSMGGFETFSSPVTISAGSMNHLSQGKSVEMKPGLSSGSISGASGKVPRR